MVGGGVVRAGRKRDATVALMAAALLSGCTVSHRMQPLDPLEAGTMDGEGIHAQGNTESKDYPCEARYAGDGRTVSWLGPSRDADRRSLAEWCSTVGPVEFRPEPSRGLPLLAGGSTFTVVTWNVHEGGGDLADFLRAELGYQCDAHGTPGFNQHFVLLAQEAYRASDAVPVAREGAPVPGRIAEQPPSGPRLDIVQVAERCGLALFYVPLMRNGEEAGDRGREDRGSAILSTLPLADPVAIELPLEAQRRVAVLATVTDPGGSPLRVVTVHFDVASNILRVLSTGGSMRVRQNEGLTEALDLLDPKRVTPIIVAGDLNTWSVRETVIQRMLKTYPDSPPPGRENTRGDWPPDHLFFRAGGATFELMAGSYRVVEDYHGSDHKARRATFAVR